MLRYRNPESAASSTEDAMPVAPNSTVASSIPLVRTALIGRAAELATTRVLLLDEAVPLLTLTGSGGVGKTRLALAIAHQVEESFAEGVVFVDLASVHDPSFVLPAIAQALGIREGGQGALVVQLAAVLKPRQLLLLLDNFEHVLDAAPAVAGLLAACPALQVLATSRGPLRLQGEQLLTVPPLALPDPSPCPEPADLSQVDAVALFVARARAVDPAFALTADNAGTVAEVCVRLEGLPLAIELAAARQRALSMESLPALLTDRLGTLTGGARDAPARQRTLRDTIAWSYDLLLPGDRAFFRRLAVFAGGFDAPAVAAVSATDPAEALTRLGTLVDQGLVRREDRTGGPARRVNPPLPVLVRKGSLTDAALVRWY
jgi:predicted ATPase